jgi:CubicO group peptidase (beta-lactamase class C family)
VVLLIGSQATVDRRTGPLNLLTGSLRPRGYVRENLSIRPAHRLDAARIAALKAFVTGGMQQLQIPGVAIGLIDAGNLVYEGGIGVRELGKPEKIDANTLFIAASNTKALTTLLLAELVDDKKLRWDEPVTEAYPSFRLGDADTTRQVRIRHLVCACTGMPRQDMNWIFGNSNETPETAMAKLAGMQPTSAFGEVFQYSNMLAAAAGFIGGSIAEPGLELGAAYDLAMREKVLGPLGMTRSTFDFAGAMEGNYARPHDVTIDGDLVVGQMTVNYSIVPLRPAGGIWTSAHDLSQYVRMELARGKLPNGKRLVSERNLLERRLPNALISENVHYGMGLVVDTRWGVTVIEHGGDLAGYHSEMMWLPDYNVGAVLLTNSETGHALREPFARKLAELIFDAHPEAELQLKTAAERIRNERIANRHQLRSPADFAAVRTLARRYHNDDLGDIVVSMKGENLIFKVGRFESAVASHGNADGSLGFTSISPNLQGIEFTVGGNPDENFGNPAPRSGGRTLIVRDAQHEYLFKEVDWSAVMPAGS